MNMLPGPNGEGVSAKSGESIVVDAVQSRFGGTPRLSALITALQADRDPVHQHEIYRRFDSEALE